SVRERPLPRASRWRTTVGIITPKTLAVKQLRAQAGFHAPPHRSRDRRPATELDDERPYRRGGRPAKALAPVLPRGRGRAQVHEQDLVFRGVDLAPEPGAHLRQLAVVEFAEEHAVLHVVALALEDLEDGVATPVVRDVVGHKIMASSHAVTSV